MLQTLKKSTPGEVRSPRTRRGPKDDAGGGRIRCPACQWQPGRDARWSCACLHEWHTFDTGGVCPACGRVWRETQCLRCQRWSPHVSWYEVRSTGGPS